ncbi:hypothetical protein C8A01DRAFT_38935 [Parachaetomium inaequale]|uniref:Uncharacterized protein n=1 Tax=Parachaetomium inaequale TaxID=2588326 RepID=A0AAN6PC07_9PEZI|nr:hypothetical protein C8A01DRAFT_38935 [Parachaetomium inaequale]
MGHDEEAKSMPQAQAPVPTSAPEINEASPALGSPEPESTHNDTKAKPPIWSIYGNANLFALLRWLFSLPMLGSAAWIVSREAAPSTSWIALPWAGYSIACASLHILLLPHRAAQPRSHTNPLPPRPYMAGLVASPVLLLLGFATGAAVLALTRSHFNERDPTGTAMCGKGASRRECHPQTVEADVFDISCVCFAFTLAALLCSLKQCYEVLYRLGRNTYTGEEIQAQHVRVSKAVNKATFSSIMKDEFGGWWRRIRGRAA